MNPAETRRLAAIIAASLLARLPHTMIGLVMVLLMRDTGRGYGITGLVAGAEVLGGGLGQPLLGRAADRFSPSLVVALSAVGSSIAFVAIAMGADSWNLGLLITLSVLAGLLIPPISGVLRSEIARTIPKDRLSAVYSLESAALETAFVVGPVAVVVCVVFLSSATTLIVSAVMLLAGTLAFLAIARPTRADRDAPHSSPLKVPRFVTLVVVALIAGAVFGGIELGVTAAMDEAGNRDASGILLACWAAGSIVGGVALAKRPISTAERRLPVLLLLGGLLCLPLTVVATVPLALAVAVFFQGLAVAPSFGTLYEIVHDTVPDNALTEAFGWAVAGTLAGFAVGAAIAGPLISLSGPPAAFLVAAAAGIGAACVAYARVRTR